MGDANDFHVFPFDAVHHAVVPTPNPPKTFLAPKLHDHVLPGSRILPGVWVFL